MNLKAAVGRIYRGETRIDFLGRRRLWFALSLAMVVASLLVIPLRPATSSCSPPLPSFFAGLNCGIEFKGGVAIQAPISPGSPLADADELEVIERVRGALADLGVPDAQVQVASDGDERSVIVQTTGVGDAAKQQAVTRGVRELTGASVEESPTQTVGRKWGGEITDKAIRALIIFLLVVLVFISWRFEWKMAVAAILALFHDLVITAGVYAFVGFEVTPSTVIAILTILGYSLYDTVVVFDKVEENTAQYAATGKMTYQDSANLAMNQVFMRSLNTSLSTLLPVAALLFVGAGLLGAGTLKDLALALLVGILIGAYSSIFFATPILTVLKEGEPRYKGVRERVLREARRAATLPAKAEVATEAREPARAAAVAGPSKQTRPPAKARVGSKKAKRRRRR
ncbi:MAG: protein translocase subunit SecF [Actinomycetota bacterium]|nr:protein translocase subunit SecF [Actinomycetota bacterium]